MAAHQLTVNIPDDPLLKRKRPAPNDEIGQGPQKRLAGLTKPKVPLLESQFMTLLWSGGPADRAWTLPTKVKIAYSSTKANADTSSNDPVLAPATGGSVDRQAIENHQQPKSKDATQFIFVHVDPQAAAPTATSEAPEKNYLQSPSVAQWLSQETVYSEKTMMCKAGKKGMERFLRSQNVDVDAEYPRTRWLYDERGEKIARNKALMKRCQQAQGDIIAERNAEMAKRAGMTNLAYTLDTANKANRTNNDDTANTKPLANMSAGTMFNGMPAATPQTENARYLPQTENAQYLPQTENAQYLHVRDPRPGTTQNPAMQSDDDTLSMLQTRKSPKTIRAHALKQVKDIHTR